MDVSTAHPQHLLLPPCTADVVVLFIRLPRLSYLTRVTSRCALLRIVRCRRYLLPLALTSTVGVMLAARLPARCRYALCSTSFPAVGVVFSVAVVAGTWRDQGERAACDDSKWIEPKRYGPQGCAAIEARPQKACPCYRKGGRKYVYRVEEARSAQTTPTRRREGSLKGRASVARALCAPPQHGRMVF